MRGSDISKMVITFTLISILIIPNLISSCEGKQQNFPDNTDYQPNSWFNTLWIYRWKINFDWFFVPTLVDYQALILLPNDFDYDVIKKKEKIYE